MLTQRQRQLGTAAATVAAMVLNFSCSPNPEETQAKQKGREVGKLLERLGALDENETVAKLRRRLRAALAFHMEGPGAALRLYEGFALPGEIDSDVRARLAEIYLGTASVDSGWDGRRGFELLTDPGEWPLVHIRTPKSEKDARFWYLIGEFYSRQGEGDGNGYYAEAVMIDLLFAPAYLRLAQGHLKRTPEFVLDPLSRLLEIEERGSHLVDSGLDVLKQCLDHELQWQRLHASVEELKALPSESDSVLRKLAFFEAQDRYATLCRRLKASLIYHTQGAEKALEAYLALGGPGKDDPDLAARLARIYIDLGEPSKAKGFLEILANPATGPEAASRRFPATSTQFVTLPSGLPRQVQIPEKDPRYYYFMGEISRQRGQSDGKEYYKQAVEVGPLFSPGYLRLAQCEVKAVRKEVFLKPLLKVLEIEERGSRLAGLSIQLLKQFLDQ